ncbi:MAG: hypothetical protein PHO37_17770 [Kiritimatiellae bacterium]|nr:hypothetical protein [Kiritimatiellia bacterium]
MKEGWWLRLDNGESFRIHEHEIDIRRPEFASKLGISDELFSHFKQFVPVTDRIEFLTWILENVPTPLARVRGHGVWATVEFSRGCNEDAFKAIHCWGREVCGPFLMLQIRNLKTDESFNMRWAEFDEAIKSGTKLSELFCPRISAKG